MRRPVPIRMRSRGDCPVLAMSPDPSKIRTSDSPYLAIFVNMNGGKWLTAGYLAKEINENNLKLPIFLNRCHA